MATNYNSLIFRTMLILNGGLFASDYPKRSNNNCKLKNVNFLISIYYVNANNHVIGLEVILRSVSDMGFIGITFEDVKWAVCYIVHLKQSKYLKSILQNIIKYYRKFQEFFLFLRS